ncbi:hypothetical protein J4Q44_G00204560 [Coregonus suidteri]|uniref:Uncharacterized protein n=1 Tax=Coregonus suidteri TaxID=861788 RepID=A0AAN8LEP5_9TELE
MAGVANRLSSASARGDLAEVEMLLMNGADVNENNAFGRTPLQVMKLGNPAIAEALLRANANPNVRDHVRGLTITHDAARDGYADTLRILMVHGADVNLLDNDGNLPLHLAAREGYLDVVQLLVGSTTDATSWGFPVQQAWPAQSRGPLSGLAIHGLHQPSTAPFITTTWSSPAPRDPGPPGCWKCGLLVVGVLERAAWVEQGSKSEQ